MEQNGSEQEQKRHNDETDTRENTQQSQVKAKACDRSHDKAEKWFDWRMSLFNWVVSALTTLGIFLLGYYLGVKPQLELATPAEVILKNEPIEDRGFPQGLSVVNLGEAIVENVRLRLGLYLISESLILTCHGLDDEPDAYCADTTRTPREKIWPRLTLKPNEEHDLTRQLYFLSLTMYSGVNAATHTNDKIDEFDESALAEAFRGRYVLLVECSYRRRADFVRETDTAYFWYTYARGPYQEVLSCVGGTDLINRLTEYLKKGPETRLNIRRGCYVAWTHSLTDMWSPGTTRIIPRNVTVDTTAASGNK